MNSNQIFNQVISSWEKVISNKSEWFKPYFFEGKVFVAGGAVVRLFGLEGQHLWQEIITKVEAEKKTSFEVIELAGIPFSITGLSLLGDFYRWLKKEKNIEDHCIDERLNELLNSESGVHQHCGASAALGSFIGEMGVVIENEALIKLGYSSKQPLIVGTESEHQSLVIHVDFDKAGIFIKPEKKIEMLEMGALPFNVSLPLELIREFFKDSNLDKSQQDLFVKTIYYWNIGLAKEIILGEHNRFADVADEFGVMVVTSKENISPNDEALLEQFSKLLDREQSFKLIEV